MPAGKTLVVTCTAPIRKNSKTSAELVELLAHALARGPARLDFKKTINGNVTRARLVKGRSRQAEAVVGFVHNPGVDVDELFTLAAPSATRSSRAPTATRR